MLLLLPACVPPPAAVADPHDTGDAGDSGAGPLAPTFAAPARWSDQDDWEPHAAADPASPYAYQATTRIGGDHADTVVRVSADGGESWGADQVLSDGLDAYDPQLAVAAGTGCVHFAWLGGPSGWGTYSRRSCDHGETWSEAVAIAPADWTTDHAWLAVSDDGQDVYLAFNGVDEPPPGGDEEEEEGGIGYVAVSHDAGASFDVVRVAGDGLTRYWFEDGADVAADGTAYVANVEFSMDYTGPAHIVLWRSADRGATWQQHTVATSEEPPACDWADGCEFGFLAAQSAVAVDEDGAVLVAWTAAATAGGDLATYVAFSPGGAAWTSFSEPVRLSEGLGTGIGISAAAGPGAGDFRVAWQGAISPGSQGPWSTFYEQTIDGGETWLDEAVPLSGAEGGYAFPYGDYMGLGVGENGIDHLAWGEGPSWTGPGATWFTRRVR